MKRILSLWLAALFLLTSTTAQALIVGMSRQSAGGASVTDDFNRADGALGSNWTSVTAGTMGVEDAVVYSNGLKTSTYQAYSMAFYNGASFSGDQYAELLMPSSAPDNSGVGLRMDSSGNGYRVVSNSATVVSAYKVTAGSPTILGSGMTVTLTTGKILRAEISGTTISVYIDGSLAGTRTDSTYDSGNPGIFNRGNKVSDNFAAGDL